MIRRSHRDKMFPARTARHYEWIVPFPKRGKRRSVGRSRKSVQAVRDGTGTREVNRSGNTGTRESAVRVAIWMEHHLVDELLGHAYENQIGARRLVLRLNAVVVDVFRFVLREFHRPRLDPVPTGL